MTSSRMMICGLRGGAALALGCMLADGLAPLAAQDYPKIAVTGRLQQHFYYFDNEAYASLVGTQSGFFTRRARIQVDGDLTEKISFVIQPSFEDGKNRLRLRDAYIDVRVTKRDADAAIHLRVGQEKRPFGRYELTSSNNLPSLERGAGRGLVKSSSNDLFIGNGFMSHDIGAAIRLEAPVGDGRSLSLHAGVYNGEGESASDVNDAKSFGARATLDITPMLNVGASVFSHDGIVTVLGVPDSSFTNTAFGFDAQWSAPGDQGLYLVGDVMTGKDATAAERSMFGLSLVGAYHVRMQDSDGFLYAVEPAVRFDWADPDTDTDDDRTTIVTAGVTLYLSSKTRVQVMYENQSFQAPGAESIGGLRTALTISF